jgi:hypothetical protein
MWGPEKGWTDIVEGVEVEGCCADSGALTVRRDGRVRQRVGVMRSLAVRARSCRRVTSSPVAELCLA